jgi:hypothetical protein
MLTTHFSSARAQSDLRQKSGLSQSALLLMLEHRVSTQWQEHRAAFTAACIRQPICYVWFLIFGIMSIGKMDCC